MVDFVQLQHILKDRLEQDRSIRSITVTSATLEDAIAEASTLLDVPVRKLEYEITERGASGFLGTGKKDWIIQAYELIDVRKEKIKALISAEEEMEGEQENPNANGEVFLHLNIDGAYLKAIPPKGKGRPAVLNEAVRLLDGRFVTGYDKDTVSKIIHAAEGEYKKVGDFEKRPVNDSMLTLKVSEMEMKAHIIITAPGIGGCDISVETYLTFLRARRVSYGINEDFLRELVDRPVYNEELLVAEALKAEDGKDAYIQYNFETDHGKMRLREGSDGRIDFKELNIIKNVVQKQPLAKKIPAAHGVVGRTVTGKSIPAKSGKDIPLPVGKNVHVGDDGLTIIADINGQVILSGGKINVEPIHTVQGNVDLKTGNIIFLGTVIINGNVEDGFSVKAAGNIEVTGTVGKADLDAEGDIIVHRGITGKFTGTIRAGRSIWARFIENAKVESGYMVVVSDGIINSDVSAFKQIVCRGKRANIVGGRLRASEEINAKVIGSPSSGTETLCEVGVDPKTKALLDEVLLRKADMEKQLEEVQLNMKTLINIKKQRKSLPKEKEAFLNELMDKRELFVSDLRAIGEEMAEVQDSLNSLETRGKVSASVKVYPGVKIKIKDAVNVIHADYKAVTFVLEGGLIRVIKYEEPNDEAKRGPDGYSAD